MTKRKKGTSLVEMLIAVMVLSVVILSVMMSIVLMTRNTGVQKDEEKARQFAIEVMEECEGVLFAQNRPFDENEYKNRISGLSRSRGGANGDAFKATSSVIQLGAVPSILPNHPPISADIRVVVEWRSALRENNKIEIEREVSVSGWQNVGDMSI